MYVDVRREAVCEVLTKVTLGWKFECQCSTGATARMTLFGDS